MEALDGEVKLLILAWLDARDLTQISLVNRSWYDLVNGTHADTQLWLPLLSNYWGTTDEGALQMALKEEGTWKRAFISAVQIPCFDPRDHAPSFTISNKRTLMQTSESVSYACARTRTPIFPGSAKYFEVNVKVNNGSVGVGVMMKSQPLEFSIPTANFYHGCCINYAQYITSKAKEPVMIGVWVDNEKTEKEKVVLHYFRETGYTHSQVLHPGLYYFACMSGTVGDMITIVKPSLPLEIPPESQRRWPVHPFLSYTY